MMEEEQGAFRGEPHELTERIIGVFFSVANELGTGFAEVVYRRAMCIALAEAGLKVQEEWPIEVWFHGKNIGVFKADIVVNGLVMLELKLAEEIGRQFEAQLLNYLRATEVEVGMVLAFGLKARFRRLSMGNETKKQRQRRERGLEG